MATAYLTCADAREALADVAPGSVRLWCGSPPYLGLVDYERAAWARERVDDVPVWRQREMALTTYLEEHGTIVLAAERTLAADAVVALEVDHVREAGALIALPDLWVQMLEAAGLRIIERITLVRPLALGHRSGHFKRHARDGRGNPGHALLDNVTSTILVAAKGNPQARIRRDAAPDDRLGCAWAERYLRNAWMIDHPQRTTAARVAGHPVPMDPKVVEALLRLYSLRGDAVLDCYAGGGTVGTVGLAHGRRPLLIEREPSFARLIAERLAPAGVRPIAGAAHPTRVLAPSAQLALPLDPAIDAIARRGFLRGAAGEDVTGRHREMARRIRQEFGIAVSPELVGLFLRAERAHYTESRRTRRGAAA